MTAHPETLRSTLQSLATSSRSRKTLLALVPLALLTYLLAFPFVGLMVGSFRDETSAAGGGSWSFEGYRTVLSDPDTFRATLSALFYSASVMLLAIASGLYLAVIVTRTRTFASYIVTPAMVVLAAVPRLFYAISWGMLGNSKSGLLATILQSLSIRAEWITVYSWPGLIVVTSLKVTAIAYLLLYGPVARMDRSLEDAAVMSGETHLLAFFKIGIPLLSPALLAIGMLLLVEGIQVFDYPALLGSGAHIMTLSTLVSDYITKQTSPNWSAASALSIIIVLLVSGLLFVQTSMTRGRSFAVIGGKTRTASVDNGGRWRLPIEISVVVFITIALILPLVQMVLGSFQPYFGLYRQLTTAHYQALISDPTVLEIVATTIALSVGGGFVVVAVAFVMTFIMVRRKDDALSAYLRIISWLPATAPGIVLSLAFAWAYLSTPIVRGLFGTPWLMLLALVAAHMPLAARACEGIMVQVGQDLEDAARVSGAEFSAVLLDITAKLCTPSLLGAWLLVGLAMSGALDIPLLLQTTTSQTVATYAYGLFNNGEAAEAAAIYCFFIAVVIAVMLLALVLVMLLRWTLRRLGLGHREHSAQEVRRAQS